MSRPLTGSLKANPSGTFTAALPAARGSKDRVPATFDRRADAQAWLDDCVTARKRDQPLPDPIRYKGRRGETVRTRTPFPEAAETWIREHYVEDGQGEKDRKEQVRRYANVIGDHLAGHGLSLEEITYKHARSMYLTLQAAGAMPCAGGRPRGHRPRDRPGTPHTTSRL